MGSMEPDLFHEVHNFLMNYLYSILVKDLNSTAFFTLVKVFLSIFLLGIFVLPIKLKLDNKNYFFVLDL